MGWREEFRRQGKEGWAWLANDRDARDLLGLLATQPSATFLEARRALNIESAPLHRAIEKLEGRAMVQCRAPRDAQGRNVVRYEISALGRAAWEEHGRRDRTGRRCTF